LSGLLALAFTLAFTLAFALTLSLAGLLAALLALTFARSLPSLLTALLARLLASLLPSLLPGLLAALLAGLLAAVLGLAFHAAALLLSGIGGGGWIALSGLAALLPAGHVLGSLARLLVSPRQLLARGLPAVLNVLPQAQVLTALGQLLALLGEVRRLGRYVRLTLRQRASQVALACRINLLGHAGLAFGQLPRLCRRLLRALLPASLLALLPRGLFALLACRLFALLTGSLFALLTGLGVLALELALSVLEVTNGLLCMLARLGEIALGKIARSLLCGLGGLANSRSLALLALGLLALGLFALGVLRADVLFELAGVLCDFGLVLGNPGNNLLPHRRGVGGGVLDLLRHLLDPLLLLGQLAGLGGKVFGLGLLLLEQFAHRIGSLFGDITEVFGNVLLVGHPVGLLVARLGLVTGLGFLGPFSQFRLPVGQLIELPHLPDQFNRIMQLTQHVLDDLDGFGYLNVGVLGVSDPLG